MAFAFRAAAAVRVWLAPRRWGRAAALLAALAAASLGTAFAQPAPFVRGSANTAAADPPVARPGTRPVRVALFSGFRFTDYAPKAFAYQPPPGRGRWAKIVLVADFSVTPGRQFDRTAQIAIGHANVYFGTTAEPSPKFGPAWHVERDITDDSALLKTAQPGEASLGTVVDAKYTGVFQGSAALLFYPADRHNPPADTPDMVLPLPDTPSGTGSLGGERETLTRTFTFPTNVVRAYLDLITQSQGQDEFWYLSVPDSRAAQLQSSGGTAFREAEISVDGTPAGVAPVYPWIYTGGIDPSLWRPIPGVQTLCFVPYRVDLTPFAGRFSNGRPHQISVRIVNNRNYFQIAGTLLLYRDPVLRVVKGALTQNTLSPSPAPVVTQAVATVNGRTSGPVSVVSTRRFVTEGYVLSSLGKRTTRVAQRVRFSSVQQFDLSAAGGSQSARQMTTVLSDTTTRLGGLLVEQHRELAYPLSILSLHQAAPDGTATQTTTVRQGWQLQERSWVNGFPLFARTALSEVRPTDTLLLDAKGAVTGSRGRTSAQTYLYADTLGNRYQSTLTAANGLLVSAAAQEAHPGAGRSK